MFGILLPLPIYCHFHLIFFLLLPIREQLNFYFIETNIENNSLLIL